MAPRDIEPLGQEEGTIKRERRDEKRNSSDDRENIIRLAF